MYDLYRIFYHRCGHSLTQTHTFCNFLIPLHYISKSQDCDDEEEENKELEIARTRAEEDDDEEAIEDLDNIERDASERAMERATRTQDRQLK